MVCSAGQFIAQSKAEALRQTLEQHQHERQLVILQDFLIQMPSPVLGHIS